MLEQGWSTEMLVAINRRTALKFSLKDLTMYQKESINKKTLKSQKIYSIVNVLFLHRFVHDY